MTSLTDKPLAAYNQDVETIKAQHHVDDVLILAEQHLRLLQPLVDTIRVVLPEMANELLLTLSLDDVYPYVLVGNRDDFMLSVSVAKSGARLHLCRWCMHGEHWYLDRPVDSLPRLGELLARGAHLPSECGC